jgi:hypothetical protein
MDLDLSRNKGIHQWLALKIERFAAENCHVVEIHVSQACRNVVMVSVSSLRARSRLLTANKAKRRT